MIKVLAIYETPCVGTTQKIIECENYPTAEDIAWNQSCSKNYVMGGYELYEIVYNNKTHHYELRYITPEMAGYSTEVAE